MRPGETYLLADGEAKGVRWPDSQSGPWFVRAHWADIDGTPACVGVELWKGVQPTEDRTRYRAIRGAPQEGIGGTDLRSIPIGRVLEALWSQQREECTSMLARVAERAAAGGEEGTADFLRGFAARISTTSPAQVRRPWADRSHFDAVAQVYREALRDRRAPTLAVAEHFTVSHSTAAKWARRARELGLLSPTSRGRSSAVTSQPTTRRTTP